MEGFFSANYGGDVTRGLRNLDADLRANKGKVVGAIMEVLRGQIVEELSHPGTGHVRWGRIRVARKGKAPRRVTGKQIAKAGRASAPGEPPAPDTGKLRGSIQTEYDSTAQKGRVGTNDVRAAPLNFGTLNAGRGHKTTILPRPFMEPALKKAATAMTLAGLESARLVLIVRRAR